MGKSAQTEESTPRQYPLDTVDIEILKMLQENARVTIKEISTRVHLSTTPVHERIKRLEESGIIRQYATLVDPAKVDRGLMVICYVSLKEHNKHAGTSFIKAMKDINEVVECYSISGEFDFLLKVLTGDMNMYYDFHVNKLSGIENVGHVQSIFVMGIIKQTHRVIW
ncbi:MAG: Lrp/AsnC family transcriptional regulator [Bacteroidota bacterium]|nr:Lrp/AsnC family transcriptional regulator [Bacteroidota bacterium]